MHQLSVQVHGHDLLPAIRSAVVDQIKHPVPQRDSVDYRVLEFDRESDERVRVRVPVLGVWVKRRVINIDVRVELGNLCRHIIYEQLSLVSQLNRDANHYQQHVPFHRDGVDSTPRMMCGEVKSYQEGLLPRIREVRVGHPVDKRLLVIVFFESFLDVFTHGLRGRGKRQPCNDVFPLVDTGLRNKVQVPITDRGGPAGSRIASDVHTEHIHGDVIEYGWSKGRVVEVDVPCVPYVVTGPVRTCVELVSRGYDNGRGLSWQEVQ